MRHTGSTPSPRDATTSAWRSVFALVLGLVLGVALALVIDDDSSTPRDPASAQCAAAFGVFVSGERTPDLLDLVNGCTREAR